MEIDKDKHRSADAAELRRHAEEQQSAKTPDADRPGTDDATDRLSHEIDVQRIELEMQNAELRQARNEVESVLAWYTDLYDFAPIGYFTLDKEGYVRAANLTGASLFGIERARMLGQSFALFVADEVRQLFREFLGRVFTSRGKESCEVELLSKGNLQLIVQIEAMIIASGEECRIAVIDISEQRRTKQALWEKEQILIHQSRLSAMGEMISNIAHQWRQPINIVGLLVQELSARYEDGNFSKEYLDAAVGKIMKQILHISKTIDDFRSFFKPDKEKVIFKVRPEIARSLSLIEGIFSDKQITIDVIDDGDPIATGYPNEFSQVLLNILHNALDAHQERISSNPHIVVKTFTENGKAVVTISDNAGGIGEEIVGRIFEPYFTTKEQGKGTGVGLYMAKIIIENSMNGSLTVRNTGEGAEFRIEV